MKPLITTIFCILSATWALITLSVNSRAQTVHVNCCGKGPGNGTQADPYKELSKAIDLSPPGSTLVLDDGAYIEGRPVIKNVTIKSAAGATAKILHHASTQKLWQLTGEKDLERGEPTASLTEKNFQLKGTDLGSVV